MKLMFIQDSQVFLGQFKELAAQPPDHAARSQQVVALHAILIRSKLDSDHMHLHRRISGAPCHVKLLAG